MTIEPGATLAAAARWRLLGLLLERPRPGWREEIAALAREVPDAALRAAAASAWDASEGAYLAIVGPGGPVSPREVAYRGLEDPGWVLADIARVYDAFAYRPRAEDPRDHVAVETGFVGYLCLKEALACAAGERAAAGTTAAARQAFLEIHLATMAAPLAQALAARGASHLAAAAAVLAASVPSCPGPRAGATGAAGGACGVCSHIV